METIFRFSNPWILTGIGQGTTPSSSTLALQEVRVSGAQRLLPLAALNGPEGTELYKEPS